MSKIRKDVNKIYGIWASHHWYVAYVVDLAEYCYIIHFFYHVAESEKRFSTTDFLNYYFAQYMPLYKLFQQCYYNIKTLLLYYLVLSVWY